MAQETNHYKLYLEDSGDTKFKEWREKMNGPSNSNMTIIDEEIFKKQDKLSGEQGQLIGFDENGAAVPQDAPDPGVTTFNKRKGDVLPQKGDYTASQIMTSAGISVEEAFDNKASAGLIGGDISARCKTNAEIDAAISDRYNTLDNCTFKSFTLMIDSTGLDVPSGNWSATIYRAATNYGYLIASSYASPGHPVSTLTRSYYGGVWGAWYRVATTDDAAPRGLTDGESILCNTNDDINAAIISKYGATKDQSARFFVLLINANNLQLAGGNWLVLMYRATVNNGFLIATRYTATHPTIYTKSLYSGSWTDFYSIAFATPPAKYDLTITDDFQRLTNNANWYTKDQIGRVTVCIYVTPVSGTLSANDFKEITTLPEGFRPKSSITFLATDPTTSHITVFSFRNNGLVVSGTTESQVKQLVGEFTFMANS